MPELCCLCKIAMFETIYLCNSKAIDVGGARGVMVIVAGIGHGDTSSNPGLD